MFALWYVFCVASHMDISRDGGSYAFVFVCIVYFRLVILGGEEGGVLL